MAIEGSKRALESWRRPAIGGYALILMTFGVMGGWAAVAPLDRAVIAPGTVVIEDSRKVVQHLEGGIVREILVREGQQVEEGATLIRLSPIQAQASLDSVRNQLDSGLAMEARLLAELQRQPEVSYPADLLARRGVSPYLARLMEDQNSQFKERQNSLAAQVTLFEAKIRQLETETSGITVEKASTEKQLGYIEDELVGLRALQEKGLIPVTRVLVMERERARLGGVVGRAVADAAKAANGMNESRLQIAQLQQKLREEVASQLLEIRQKIGEGKEKFVVAQDMLKRLEIAAPRAGTVQNLKVFTIGQVVRSGESLLEIVPNQETLVIHVQLPVNEIEHLDAGQKAEIRFPAFHSRRLPLITGRLSNISRDRLIDDATKQPYFLGIVRLPQGLPESYRSRLIAGMQSEVVIATGERTALDYLIQPLNDAMRGSFAD